MKSAITSPACLHKKAFDNAGLIYGMGHAVYSVSDPRARIMERFAEGLSKEKGREDEYGLYMRVAAARAAGHRRKAPHL